MTADVPNNTDVSNETIRSVRAELGLPNEVPLNVDGLTTVYGAWCRHMGFDNIRKVTSLRSGDSTLGGESAEDYFRHWLEHRSGGTCWPSSNALYALIASYGFEARRVAGSMFDMPMTNHGSVKVRIDGRDWLADSSMLTERPLPLTGELHIKSDGVRTEVEPRDGTWMVWTDFPPLPEFIPCRLRDDPVDLAFYRERYENSRQMSPFNDRLYFRRITENGMVMILGSTMFRRNGEDLEVHEMRADELCDTLHNIGGVSRSFISQWVDAGGLAATMNPSGEGPKFPDPGPRPSRRGA